LWRQSTVLSSNEAAEEYQPVRGDFLLAGNRPISIVETEQVDNSSEAEAAGEYAAAYRNFLLAGGGPISIAEAELVDNSNEVKANMIQPTTISYWLDMDQYLLWRQSR
jgi:hypothetical protein